MNKRVFKDKGRKKLRSKNFSFNFKKQRNSITDL